MNNDIKNAYFDGYDAGYNAGFEAGQRDVLMKDLPSAQPTHNNPSNALKSLDCIDRQAAIDALKNRWKKTRNYEGNGDDIAEECELYLNQVPSAQPTIEPERKTGTWYEHYSHEDGERDEVRCSECGTHYYFEGQLMNFCPNCGADMREGEAE